MGVHRGEGVESIMRGWNAMLMSRQGDMRVAALSHDLRTPVTSVVALTRLALEAQGQGEVERCLGELLVAANALESIAGDLMVSGEKEDEFSGEELERELRVLAGRRAREKGQRLTVDMGALRGLFVAADRSALERILVNLLTNAIKYTQEGGEIGLTASIRQNVGDSVGVTFVVCDNGMGMKQDFLRKLYRPYARAKEAVLSRIPGTGMGLAIVRRLVERMHGTIDADSKWGEGTAFTICVPMRLVHPTAIARNGGDDRSCLVGKRLLVAEDNALCARIAQQILSNAKAEVEVAADGADAVRLFAKGRYDAVVMDMRMPGMDGCAAAEAIRRQERQGRHVPIVAMTAGQEAQDRGKALRAGMDDCLLKPLEVDRLARVLKRCWDG